MVKVGIIGGSGIYNPSMFHNVHPVSIDTPFGLPSDPIMAGEYDGIEVAFLSQAWRGPPIFAFGLELSGQHLCA